MLAHGGYLICQDLVSPTMPVLDTCQPAWTTKLFFITLPLRHQAVCSPTLYLDVSHYQVHPVSIPVVHDLRMEAINAGHLRTPYHRDMSVTIPCFTNYSIALATGMLQQLGYVRCHSSVMHTISLPGIRYIPINSSLGPLGKAKGRKRTRRKVGDGTESFHPS